MVLECYSWLGEQCDLNAYCARKQMCTTMGHMPFKGSLIIKRVFIHSFGTCRMRQFLAILRSFFHYSLLCTFSCHPSPPTIHPSSLTSSCHLFLGLPPILLLPNSYITLFREFYFLPVSVHAQTNVIYLTLLSLLQ